MRALTLTFTALLAIGADATATVPDEDRVPTSLQLQSNPFLEITTYRLWPGRAPGATNDDEEQTPTITVFTPQLGFSNGSAIVIVPGGAYTHLAGSIEGRQIADWFAARGVTAFVLKYRVGPNARLPISLAEGPRAIRFVRAYARYFGIDPHRLGLIGFSAGGHLSAMTASQADGGKPGTTDILERESSRPDFLILGYPWLEATRIDPVKHLSQYCVFAGTGCRSQDYIKYMPIEAVTGSEPPTFIYHTTSDELVPVDGSVRYYQALRAKGVSVEMHLFANGPHGTGLGGSDRALAEWPEALANWLQARGIFGSPDEPAAASRHKPAPPIMDQYAPRK